jgi:hypothetical protein
MATTAGERIVRRSFTKFDRYFWDFCDSHCMTAHERIVIVAICTEAQWQDRTWTGSILDLSNRTKVPRGKVKAIMDDFVQEGILECRQGFRSNSMGVFFLRCYEDMLVPERPRTGRPVGSTDSYPRSRSNRSGQQTATQVQTKEMQSVREVLPPAQIGSPKSLIRGHFSYKSPSEAERDEVGEEHYRKRERFTDEELWGEDYRGEDEQFRSNQWTSTVEVELCIECGQPCDSTHPFDHDAVLPHR